MRGIRISVSFDKIIKNPRSKLNFNIQSGDEIIISPRPNIVTIQGEVNSSGIRKYVDGKRLNYYVGIAGGLSPNADRKNIWIEYPNGDSEKYNKWSLLSPRVIDGSLIIIGKKPEEEPFDRTEYAKDLTSILASLAQAISMIVLASR